MSAVKNLSPTGDPWLLTPGPLTTSKTVKEAMLHDYGSRDTGFIRINAEIRGQLVDIIHGQGSHECIPLQGSGTFVVEAMIGNFVPASGKLLVLINGAYGQRIVKICGYYGIPHSTLEWLEDQPVDVAQLDAALKADTDITHVAMIHCETTSGIVNPLAAVAVCVAANQRGFLIDSMSIFGAVEIDSREIQFDALVASSNKCLEGVPGMGFCLARRGALEKTKGNARSLSLDLYDQWQAMEANAQWRFTPPTHCLLAMHKALEEFNAAGGVMGRGGRYQENCDVLVTGMRKLGFKPLLPSELQAPIIVTFHMPEDPKFIFQDFYDALRERGFVIYPGKLTVADSFRVGCIGRLDTTLMKAALDTIGNVLEEMGVSSGAPAGS
jgi:2-aminoethylphosphonate-pyruvate transaminase